MGFLQLQGGRTIWDVVVVGAGPAGSTCATHLAKSGHRVLLLEQERTPGAAANCTGIIGIEAFEVFNLPRELIVGTIDSINFVGPFRREVKFSVGRDLAHIVRRQQLDNVLAQRAVEAGARLCVGARVVGGHRYPGGIEIRGVQAASSRLGGQDERKTPLLDALARTSEPPELNESAPNANVWPAFVCRARALVLAVGYNLTLLRAFGLEGPRRFVQGAQLLCRNRGVEEVHVFLGSNYAPGSFGWAVPLDKGLVKVGLTTAQRALTYLSALVDGPHLRGLVDVSDARPRLSPIPVGAMHRCHDDRLLVIGEAAGQVKTTSNGGIYYSMLGARVAGETLDCCLRADTLGASALAAYDRAWREILADEIAIGSQLRAALEAMSDRKLAALMWLASLDGLLDLVRERADFDWHRPLVEDLMRHRAIGPFFGNAGGG